MSHRFLLINFLGNIEGLFRNGKLFLQETSDSSIFLCSKSWKIFEFPVEKVEKIVVVSRNHIYFDI